MAQRVELRMILILNPVAPVQAKLSVRLSAWQYESIDWPIGKKLNPGQIRIFLGKHYGIPPGEVVWPEHVRIPDIS